MQEAIDFLLTKNPIFQEIIDKYGLPPIPKRPQGFETLVLLILEQQVSVDSAKATFLKIKAYTTCNPEMMSILPDEEFRALGVSRQKTKYIKILSEAVLNKELVYQNDQYNVDGSPLISIDFAGLDFFDPIWSDHADLISGNKAFKRIFLEYRKNINAFKSLLPTGPGYGIIPKIKPNRILRKKIKVKLRSITQFIDQF